MLSSNLRKSIAIVGIALIALAASAQEKTYKVNCIAFYNLENLFDTIPGENDTEFSPNSPKQWATKRYFEKMERMGRVISQIGDEFPIGTPAIVGLCEIENRSVLEDLVKASSIATSNYKIVHYDSPDKRGVDVGLIYRPDLFKVTSTRSVRLTVPGMPDFRSRDQLVVSGLLEGEQIHIIVNHWPSRSGGEKRSMPGRIAAGKLSRSIVDSIQSIEPNAKIIIMGDLNDDPVDKSITTALGAKLNEKDVKPGDLYAAMYPLYKNGIGTLAYRDSWSLFDNIIITEALLNSDGKTLKFHKVKVFNRPFLLNKTGQYAGYPLRTYVGSTYQAGYSDHFPVYMFVIKEKE